MSNQTAYPRITGATRVFGFIGHPVIYAKSPENFNPLIAAAGHDGVLVPMDILPNAFDTAIRGVMALANIEGFVVTMPHKARLIPFLDEITKRAEAIGAVNAAKRTSDGRWIGDIFDGVGLVGAARSIGVELKNARVGLLGAGGAGAAIAFALAEEGVASLTISDLDLSRATKCARRITSEGAIEPVVGAINLNSIDLLINATPVGMDANDGFPIDTSALSPSTTVIDIVTKPSTPLLIEAERRGCRNVGGAAMVAAQTRAILKFFGVDAV